MKTEGPTKSLLDEEFDRLDQPFDDRKPMSVASSHFNASFVQARLRQLGVFHSDHVSIAAEGFQLSKSKRFKFGKGIYSTTGRTDEKLKYNSANAFQIFLFHSLIPSTEPPKPYTFFFVGLLRNFDFPPQ